MFWFGGSVYATEEEVQSLVQGYMARRERQAAELLSDIRQKVAAQRLDGLINTVNKYLAEKPNDNEVLALRKSLVDRQDKLTKEVVSRYERATQFMQQCLFNDAAKELNLIPESVRTAEATGSLNKCRELESLRQAAFLELTKPDASSNANAIKAGHRYRDLLATTKIKDAQFEQLLSKAEAPRREAFRKRVQLLATAAAIGLVVAGLWFRSTMRANTLQSALTNARWTEALKIDPRNLSALIGRARTKLTVSSPDLEAAIVDIESAERLSPGSSDVKALRDSAFATRAVVFASKDNIAEASRNLWQAQRLGVDGNALMTAKEAIVNAWIARVEKARSKTQFKQAVNGLVRSGATREQLEQLQARGLITEVPPEARTPAAVVPPGVETLINSLGMRFNLCCSGTFTTGDANGATDERPHTVAITKPFYIGVYEVTNVEHWAVMNAVPSHWKDEIDRPVEKVNWGDTIEFCERLSALPEERAAGRIYRLPTKAEWEYACRAGTTSAYSFGDDKRQLGDVAWFEFNSGRETHPVGQKEPNAWGLYDMHGNVREWCNDYYSGGYNSAANEGYRVLRGGAWIDKAERCRSASQVYGEPTKRMDDVGFRLALSLPGVEQPKTATGN